MIINNFLSLLNRYKTDLTTFTIVGVGPGDPSLLTIAAVDAIKKAKVIVFQYQMIIKRVLLQK